MQKYTPHPAALLFPEPSDEEYEALKKDICEHGLINPIVICRGQVVDGRSRLRICGELGIKPRFQDGGEKTDAELVTLSVGLNLHRRHLTPEQKRELVAKLLETTPEKSDRQIAETAKVSPTTVGAIRRRSGVQGGHLPKRTGKDGKSYSTPKARSKPNPSATPPQGKVTHPHRPQGRGGVDPNQRRLGRGECSHVHDCNSRCPVRWCEWCR